MAALTIKEKGRKKKLKQNQKQAGKGTDGSKTGLMNGQIGNRGGRVKGDGGVWGVGGSSEVTHVPVICPAGVGPAVHVVAPVSIP